VNNGGLAVALVGVTASGKSALAHELARTSGGEIEIVAVDAMTVYRHMDIATAKPTPRQRREVAYHLLDLIEPSEEFTLAAYQRAAREAVVDVWQRGRAALYVGGTGLYARAVLDNFEIPSQYPEIRQRLELRANDDLAALYAELHALDPLAASRMEPTNARRVVRALEVTLGSGRPFSSYGAGLRTYGAVRVVQVGLHVDFAVLDERLESRFRAWLDEGLLDEVATLAASPLGLSRTARQAVGYRELLRHVELGVALEECVQDAITQSRRLARRQRRWFARDPRIEWFGDAREASERLLGVLGSPDGFVRD
jgi:tRNA dimethylallyltransferase